MEILSVLRLKMCLPILLMTGTASSAIINPTNPNENDPVAPGTPLDGYHHDVTLFESTSETVASAMIDDDPHLFLPDDQGLITLSFPVAQGTLEVFDPDGTLSDTLTFSGGNKLKLTSDSGDASPAEQGLNAEVVKVPADIACGPSAPNSGGCYFIDSPSEEIPEPSSLGLLAVGLASLARSISAPRRRSCD